MDQSTSKVSALLSQLLAKDPPLNMSAPGDQAFNVNFWGGTYDSDVVFGFSGVPCIHENVCS